MTAEDDEALSGIVLACPSHLDGFLFAGVESIVNMRFKPGRCAAKDAVLIEVAFHVHDVDNLEALAVLSIFTNAADGVDIIADDHAREVYPRPS